MKLLRNRILIRAVKPQKEDRRKIVIPETVHDPKGYHQYQVLAVGPGKKLRNGLLLPTCIRPGDYVLTNLYFDHVKLENGDIICDADQIEAYWEPAFRTEFGMGAMGPAGGVPAQI